MLIKQYTCIYAKLAWTFGYDTNQLVKKMSPKQAQESCRCAHMPYNSIL